MKIGYQGVENSYNHIAAKEFVEKFKIKDPDFIPLTSSSNVVKSLKSGKIDFGIMAMMNSIAGVVDESYHTLKTESFHQLTTIINQIDHCLFMHPEAEIKTISNIASHEMALKQCSDYLGNMFPKSNQLALEDTALSALKLKEGKLDKNTAVICSKQAGVKNGLSLIDQNIQNNPSNFTEFRVFKKRKVEDKLGFINKVFVYFFSDDKPEVVFKIFLAIMILLTFLFYDYLLESTQKVGGAWFLAGIYSLLLGIFSSKKLRNRFNSNFIIGHWVYYAITDREKLDPKQRFHVPRVVEIFREGEKIKFSIYIADISGQEFAKSVKVLHSNLARQNGDLIYSYERADKPTADFDFNGLVHMKWKKKKPWRKISEMTARYLSEGSDDQGNVNYYRISEKEFDAIKNADYIQHAENL